MRAVPLFAVCALLAGTAAGQSPCLTPVPEAVISVRQAQQQPGNSSGVLALTLGSAGPVRNELPGTQFLAYRLLTPPARGLSTELPGTGAFRRLLSKLHYVSRERIVIYPSRGIPFVALARAWATFDLFGLGDQTSIVQAGFGDLAWRSRPQGKRGTAVRLCQPGIASTGFVATHIRSRRVRIVDARLPGYFRGDIVEARGERQGHIPGAINLPFRRLLAGGGLRSLASLRQIFSRTGLKHSDELVVYCHSGQKAAVVYLAARLLGYRVRLFDGSWQAWSRDRRLPTSIGKEGPQGDPPLFAPVASVSRSGAAP